MKFALLTAVTTKSVFWDVTQYSLVDRYQHLAWTSCLHLQENNLQNTAINQTTWCKIPKTPATSSWRLYNFWSTLHPRWTLSFPSTKDILYVTYCYKNLQPYEVWDSHCGVYKEYCLLECNPCNLVTNTGDSWKEHNASVFRTEGWCNMFRKGLYSFTRLHMEIELKTRVVSFSSSKTGLLPPILHYKLCMFL